MAAPRKPTVRELAKGTRLGFVMETFGGQIGGAGAAARSPIDPLLKATGLYMVGQVQRAFTDQRRGRVAWRERSVPNLAGIVRDLDEGGEIKSRRWDARPAVIDTGLLRGSIWFRRLTDGTVGIEVGTTVPYARKQQEGGPTTIEIGARAQERIKALLAAIERTGKGKAREIRAAGGGKVKGQRGLADALRFLRGRDSFELRIPARPYVTVEPEDIQAIRDMAAKWALRETGRTGTPWLGGTP